VRLGKVRLQLLGPSELGNRVILPSGQLV